MFIINNLRLICKNKLFIKFLSTHFMPEINFLNFLIIFAWSLVALWLAAFIWTFYCLKNQIPLKLNKNLKLNKKPFVSILVPARNEADRVLEKSINSMLAQTYENFELIVLNDRSTDQTKEILQNIKTENPRPDFKIIDGREPEKNWLGKPHALEQAFAKSSGEWILSTDADIIFARETLQNVIAYAEENNFDALTLIPKVVYGTFWERFFMPVFAWFCVLAMPLHLVNNPKRKESMGIGNFFLFKRKVLNEIGGFEIVKLEVAEDLKLAEIIKSKGLRLHIDDAPDFIQTRMYSGFGEIWEGFTKNLFSGMKFSLAKTIFGAVSIFLFGVLPVFFVFFALLFGQITVFIPLFIVYILQIAVFVLIYKKWSGNPIYAFLAPLGLLIFLAILVNSTIKVSSGKGVTWKGRQIYEKGGVRPPANEFRA